MSTETHNPLPDLFDSAYNLGVEHTIALLAKYYKETHLELPPMLITLLSELKKTPTEKTTNNELG